MMSATRLKALVSLARDRRGVSAVEFALLLPFMLTLYFGGVEVSQVVALDRKTSMVARTTGDLVSQVSTCKTTSPPADISGIFSAAKAVVAPYSDTALKVIVSCLKIDQNGGVTLMWSRGYNTGAHTSASTIPDGLTDPTKTTYWVWSEASYDYTPMIGYVLTGTYTLTGDVHMMSRL